MPGRLAPYTIVAKPQGLCDCSHFTDKKSKAQRPSCTITGSELGLSDVKATDQVDLKVQREGPPTRPARTGAFLLHLQAECIVGPPDAVLTCPHHSRLAAKMRGWMSGQVCPGAHRGGRGISGGRGSSPPPPQPSGQSWWLLEAALHGPSPPPPITSLS